MRGPIGIAGDPRRSATTQTGQARARSFRAALRAHAHSVESSCEAEGGLLLTPCAKPRPAPHYERRGKPHAHHARGGAGEGGTDKEPAMAQGNSNSGGGGKGGSGGSGGNPNYPSTTGKPSGGGRGNGPKGK